jgi:ATP-dependent DNA helicase RecG
VGRNTAQSYCYLFTDSDNPAVYNRLRSLERTSDGFRLAQIDLELRGPGEIYGTAQHGQLNLRMSSMLDTRLIERAKTEAQAFLTSGNMLKYPLIVERINRLKNVTTLD